MIYQKVKDNYPNVTYLNEDARLLYCFVISILNKMRSVNMILGEQIKKHRQLLNMTQEDLSQKLNTTRQTVSKWEKHMIEPDINTLLKLSDIFNISLNELITGKKEQNEHLKEMNLWEFLSEKWWLVMIIVIIICGSVAQIFS